MDFPKIEIGSKKELREWLTRHHSQRESIWLVTWKKGDPRYFPYGDIVDEALCFGWIDSLPRKLDAARTMLLLSPRKKGSAWSAVNKAKVKRLIVSGDMTSAGMAKIEEAKADGSWNLLDGLELLEMPGDLVAEFQKVPAAALENWNGFSPSSRRGILEWITLAKSPETRARRIAETANLAGQGIKANHPKGRDR